MPSGPPQSLSVVVLNSTSVNISWEDILLSEQNGIIIFYNITVIELNTSSIFGMWTINETDFYSGYTLHIRGLHPFYYYEVFVAGSTVVGIGPNASMEFQTSQDGKL